MKKWQCTVCGYIHQGDSPPDNCPVCGADKSFFGPYDEAASEKPAEPLKAESGAPITANQWQCTVCGYIHNGSEPPEKCPVCGADKSLFIPIPDSTKTVSSNDPSQETAQQAEQKQKTGKTGLKPPWDGHERLTAIARMLTELHGHPIAVHIPNGVLPVTVLFGLLALLFRSESFAIAAGYNMVFVCLAMPIVIATGLVDWINRFGGRMTYIFRNKLICAGVVTFLSLILGIWWLTSPEIYQRGFFTNWFFILLHLIDLGAAGLAGWFGGKLVFK